MADVVGFVAQDPLDGFVTDAVEEELAYAMEQLDVPAAVMRTRVEETLDLLGIADLRDRPLRDLSGGQQQRVAIGSVLTAGPRILVLDEPTSALDPAAAEEVLAALLRLVHDLGLTVVLAEHRLERAIQYADRLVSLAPDGSARSGAPSTLMADAPIAPPVVELGRLAGWDPLPLSVRDARRQASALRDRLAHPLAVPSPAHRPVALAATGISVRYGATVAVRDVDLELRAGEVAVLAGRNGSGKSSLLWALHGAGRRSAGAVRVDGPEGARLVGLVPQTPGDLLFLDSVAAECSAADADAGAPGGVTRDLLDGLVAGVEADLHPRDLSEGQRLALVLAIQLAAAPRVILLDEPTRGLDYPAKRRFAGILRSLAAAGHAVLVATHDVELAALVADRVLVLAGGDLVADGAPREILGRSTALAPQVARILGPGWLTVDQVRAALVPESVGGAAS
jgi:energy-coupling factor transport system ATP-binding protein